MATLISVLKNKKICGQARELVVHVHNFLKDEAEKYGEQLPHLNKVIERVSMATSISKRSVSNILREEKILKATGKPYSFTTPRKKSVTKRRKLDVDDFCKNAIIRIVRNFHINEKELPTIRKLHKKIIEAHIGFTGSPTSLRRLLRELGLVSFMMHEKKIKPMVNIGLTKSKEKKDLNIREDLKKIEIKNIVYLDHKYAQDSICGTMDPLKV